MNIEEIDFLLSVEGSQSLQQLAKSLPESFVVEKEILKLHKRNIPHLQLLMSQIALRRKAIDKFPEASQLLFTKEGLEQATREEIAEYVASRYQPFDVRVDMTAGIGGDAREILKGASQAIALERDPVTLRILRHNFRIWNLDQVQFLEQNAYSYNPPQGAVLYLDPMRRDALGRRTSQISLWEPNPITILSRLPDILGSGVKVSPAFDYQELEASDLVVEVEMIGWQKNLKQAVWWTGVLSTPGVTRKVTLLPSGWTLDNSHSAPEITCLEPCQYIIDPHPAILRAQLADHFCSRYSLFKLDPHIGYFTTQVIPDFESPDIARVYRVIDVSKYNLRNLKKTLKSFHLKSARLRQRGFPIELQVIQKKLNLPEGNDCTILLARIGPSLFSIIAEKV
jgi:hypothetical protein